MDAVAPGLPRPEGLLDPHSALTLLRETLQAIARTDGSVALLTPGPGSPAFYEHSRLAEGAGLLLVQPGDVDVRDGGVVDARSGERIAVLYLRLDGELAELVDDTGTGVGTRLLDAAAAGTVVLANAPGNGVADDKAMYCHVPALIGYYLQERPLLDSVPTYRTSDVTERLSVLERIGELVTKPVDGSGGEGVLIGPVASAAAVAARRQEISAQPDAWVAQEVVPLSSLPTFAGTQLEPRHVDLRVFVYLHGTGPGECRLADVALTRVAPRGSLVVNSSRGGGAKDTWIVSDACAGWRVSCASTGDRPTWGPSRR
jgi:carboxylate-amine ligase